MQVITSCHNVLPIQEPRMVVTNGWLQAKVAHFLVIFHSLKIHTTMLQLKSIVISLVKLRITWSTMNF
jgi:hypothetical protein